MWQVCVLYIPLLLSFPHIVLRTHNTSSISKILLKPCWMRRQVVKLERQTIKVKMRTAARSLPVVERVGQRTSFNSSPKRPWNIQSIHLFRQIFRRFLWWFWLVYWFFATAFLFWRVVGSFNATNRSSCCCLPFCVIFSPNSKARFSQTVNSVIVIPSESKTSWRNVICHYFWTLFSLNPNVDPWFNRLTPNFHFSPT